MKQSLVKRGLVSLGLGAAALVLSTTQAFAISTVMDTADVTIFNGSGSHDLDRQLKFDFSSDWSSFVTALTTDGLSSAFLHVDLTPLSGFNGDRFRVFTTPGDVVSNSDTKLIPIAGDGSVRDGMGGAEISEEGATGRVGAFVVEKDP